MAIQIRNGTNTEWENNNSNIVVGEPAIATDAERFFVGTASGDYAEFANLDIIAPAYDTSTLYVVGDVINRQGKLYSCNTPCSGAFNVSYWDEKSLAEILKDLENEIDYAQYEIGYASGELITIDNGASEIPVKDLTVDIEAVQDLHGYDYPWVGGAGKNLCPYPFQDGSSKTTNGITFTANADGSIKINGTATANAQFWIKNPYSLKAGTYTISGFPSTMPTGNNTYLRVYSATANFSISEYSIKKNERTGTLSQDVSDVWIWITISSGDTVNNVTIYPMLELGSTASSFAPYSNICPISGWDEVNVNVTGENLLDESMIQIGSYSTNGSNGSNGDNKYRRFSIDLPAGTYTYSTDLADCYIIRILVDNVEQWIKITTQIYTFTLDKASNVKFAVRNTSSTPITTSFFMQIELGTTATAYEPYNGQTYTIDLDGTRYGGTLDVTTGVLTVTHEYIDLRTYGISGTAVSSNVRRWYTTQNPVFKKVTLCNSLKTSDSYVYTSLDYASISTDKRIAVTPTWGQSITTVDDFNTAIANNPISVVIELATPQVVQLTPTQVRTVLGTNNLWNQMNSNNELAYRISNALN